MCLRGARFTLKQRLSVNSTGTSDCGIETYRHEHASVDLLWGSEGHEETMSTCPGWTTAKSKMLNQKVNRAHGA